MIVALNNGRYGFLAIAQYLWWKCMRVLVLIQSSSIYHDWYYLALSTIASDRAVMAEMTWAETRRHVQRSGTEENVWVWCHSCTRNDPTVQKSLHDRVKYVFLPNVTYPSLRKAYAKVNLLPGTCAVGSRTRTLRQIVYDQILSKSESHLKRSTNRSSI